MPPLLKHAPVPAFAHEGIAVYNSDCRDVLPMLSSDSVDCIVTDPPYGHNNNSNGDLIHRREAALGKGPHGEARAIANDGQEDIGPLIRWSFEEWARLLSRGCCCCCCCGGGGPDPQFARWSLWLDEHLDFKQMVVWDKGPMGMGWHYRRSYETVLVAQKPGAACRWYDESMAVENIIRPGDEVRKIIPRADQHPTAKPVELYSHFLRLHTKPGDLVVDPFMGDGVCGVACVEMGRRFVGVEVDAQHCYSGIGRIRAALVAAGKLPDTRLVKENSMKPSMVKFRRN
jgi:DNA modification methylase